MNAEQLFDEVKKFRSFAGQGIMEYYVKLFSESIFPPFRVSVNEVFTSEHSSRISENIENLVLERAQDISEKMSIVFSEMLMALIMGRLVQLEAFEIGLAALLKMTLLRYKP